jgi:hypothetical protein
MVAASVLPEKQAKHVARECGERKLRACPKG